MFRTFLAKLGISALVASATLAGTAVWVVSEVEPAAAADFPIHDFNLCGNRCNGSDFDPVNVVAFLVLNANPRPVVVSLQEVCKSQFDEIQFRLANGGYGAGSGRLIVTKTQGLAAGCGGQYGNAVFALGTYSSEQLRTFTAQDNNPCSLAAGHECRKAICVRYTTAFIGAFVGCSTHLSPNRQTTAAQQALEFLPIVNGWYTTDRRMLGADFNQLPLEPELDGWYSAWQEADGNTATDRSLCSQLQNCPTHDTGFSDEKIDFIWGRTNLFIRLGATYTTRDRVEGSGSDHWYFRGTAAW